MEKFIEIFKSQNKNVFHQRHAYSGILLQLFNLFLLIIGLVLLLVGIHRIYSGIRG